MKNDQVSDSIQNLFSNQDPIEVWVKAAEIIHCINPAYDLSDIRKVFRDTVDIFNGKYPGYCAIKTPFHDLHHTLDVFLCAVRLLHGMHVSGATLRNSDITLVAIASMMHDIGFVQECGTEAGTGARFMQIHVRRGIEFMRHYLAHRGFPSEWEKSLTPMIQTTDLDLQFDQIAFLNERVRLLGQIVSTADLIGQMADRTYLEKLLFLYEEFKEANFKGYQNPLDLLRQTQSFYTMVQRRLDAEYSGVYKKLAFHFKEWFGIKRNFYMEAIDKNIAYLSELALLDEKGHLSKLRRAGIASKVLMPKGALA